MFGIFVLGNELSGNGIGAHVHADQYGKDLVNLRRIINELYKGSQSKPSLVAPGGFYDEEWFVKLLQTSGFGVIDVMSHHMYNLGAGVFGYTKVFECMDAFLFDPAYV